MTDPTQTAEQLQAATPSCEGKPVLASWMGGADVAAGEAILNRAGIPTFPYPDTAARVFTLHVALHRQPARRCTRRPHCAGDADADGPTATGPRRIDRGRVRGRAARC